EEGGRQGGGRGNKRGCTGNGTRQRLRSRRMVVREADHLKGEPPMATMHESEWELEEELEGLGEFEHHEHAHESEWEHPAQAHEFESEWEAHEAHELESEHHEHAHEFESELEGELEAGEEFFGRIARGIGRFVRRAAPILRSIAQVAAPMLAT